MYNEKTLHVIESIKNMPDREADILEIFIAGFRAGKQTQRTEMEMFNSSRNPPRQTA